MAHVVIAHYDEDLSWTQNLRYPFTIYSKQDIPDGQIPNKGYEVSSYLRYIIDHYHQLCVYTVFVHGHRKSWHSTQNMDDKINDMVFDQVYQNINTIQEMEIMDIEKCNWADDMCAILDVISHSIKESIHVDRLVYYQAAQFYVHRDLIRRNPLHAYIAMYEWIMASEMKSWKIARGFEYTWHFIMTGMHMDPTERRDMKRQPKMVSGGA